MSCYDTGKIKAYQLFTDKQLPMIRLNALMGACLLLTVACGPAKTKFNDAELKWLTVYHTGDSLIFRGTSGQQDTSVIVQDTILYPEYMPFEVHDFYLPQTGEIWYKNKALEYHKDGDQMISLIKRTPRKETIGHISYLYGGFIIENLARDGLAKLRTGKVYAFNTFHSKAPTWQPKMIYWHQDSGIVKYITHGGEEWKLIAWRRK